MCLQSLIPFLTPINLHSVRKAVFMSLVISASRWHFLFDILPWWLPVPSSSQTETEGPWRFTSHHGLPFSNSHQSQGDGLSSSPSLPLSDIPLCWSLSAQHFVLLSAQELSCWGASPSVVEESTFRNKNKGLVTIARHMSPPTSCHEKLWNMLAQCIKDALHNLELRRTLSDTAAPEKKPRNHKRACCSLPAPPQGLFCCYLKNFLQKSAGYQWAANIKTKPGTVISFQAKRTGQFMANVVP